MIIKSAFSLLFLCLLLFLGCTYTATVPCEGTKFIVKLLSDLPKVSVKYGRSYYSQSRKVRFARITVG